MVRIGGGVFPHIKEPDYLVSFHVAQQYHFKTKYNSLEYCGIFHLISLV